MIKMENTKERDKEFKSLEKENEPTREEIKLFLFDCAISERDINHIFLKVNELINNEIEQESLCGW
jgi:hypothetical protein